MSAADIEQDAVAWLIQREDGNWSDREQAALDAWLDQSLAHKAAFWRLEHGWREADRVRALGLPSPKAGAQRFGFTSWRFALPVAASLIGVISLTVAELAPRHPVVSAADQRFTTSVGGRSIVPLVDGSKIELNTATVLRTAVTERHREVWLDHGEAYFQIAHRDGRPFIVHAGSRTITVLGTKFSVRRDGDKVTVSVIEGRVEVQDAERPEAVPAAILTAGDVAIARGPSTLLAAKSEELVKSTLAWRDGILNFDRTSLSDAVTEFNRYNIKQIEITDQEAGGIRIGGTFQASNVDAFVRLLHEAYGLRVDSDGATIKISS